MALPAPTIIGPISELTKSIHVQGQWPGSTIVIKSIGPVPREVVRSIAATGGDDYVDLLPGMSLLASDMLVAKQTDAGGNESLFSPEASARYVGATPTSELTIGPPVIRTHLHECGQYVYVSNSFPGATVEMVDTDPKETILGSAISMEGVARMQLAAGLATIRNIKVRNRIGAIIKPVVDGTVNKLPSGTKPSPPAPIVNDSVLPLTACEFSLPISHVLDGATVIVRRKGGGEAIAGFDLSSLLFILPNALKEGDELTVTQNFPWCQLEGKVAAASVGPPKKPPAPLIAPLCAGASTVRLTGLKGGAAVTLAADGIVYEAFVGRDAMSLDINVGRLHAGKARARQELCGILSDWTVVDVDPHQKIIDPPTIELPVVGCARTITVTNVHPGSQLQAFSRFAGITSPISDVVTFEKSSGVIRVSPTLFRSTDTEISEVFVEQSACGDKPIRSANREVLGHGDLTPKIVTPVISGDGSIDVIQVCNGSTVYVYDVSTSDPELIGQQDISALDGEPKHIGLIKVLKTGMRIRLIERICNDESRPVETVVLVPPPLKPVHLSPSSVTGVSLTPVITWEDPGAGTERAATSYFMTFGSHPTVSVVGTSFSPGSLAADTLYQYGVRPINLTDYGDNAIAHFTTGKAPLPPVVHPVLSFALPGATKLVVSGKGFNALGGVDFLVSVKGTAYGFPDYFRYGFAHTTADASGNFVDFPLDLISILPIFNFPDGSGYHFTGAVAGEIISIVAKNSSATTWKEEASGVSNIVSFTLP